MNDTNNTHAAEQKTNSEPMIGTIITTGKAMGFVTLPDREDEVVIEPDFINNALNGDTVEIIITGKYMSTKRLRPQKQTSAQEAVFQQMAGQVTRIVTRAKDQFVGMITQVDGKTWVRADDRRVYADFLIPQSVIDASTDPLLKRPSLTGIKVVVKIAHWNPNERFATGDIVQVLGERGNHETEMQSIILDRGIDTTFPPDVDREAHDLEKTEKPIRPDEIAGRRDMRKDITFTIDPADAKDFDDALSLKKLPDGMLEIGIHIADVSHYVQPGTALDREALNRSFSVYLVDRTIPMLPEVLSNDLCSLNPHEDKLAFSCVVKIDMNGIVHDRWFGKTIINSDKRFTYEVAQQTINDGRGEFFEELDLMNKVGKKLLDINYKNGAINFEQDEVRFKLDEHGKPIDVYRKERLDTHKLVEEYMLLANKEVAEFIFNEINGKTNRASIYRIHDLPNSERLEELALFLRALGYNLPVKQGKVSARDINHLLEQVTGVPEESLIKTATIRSMAKAVYSTKDIGHFGLGFEHYTHFTSPIRRYPDLMVHRILQWILTNTQSGEQDENKEFEHISRHASDKEVAAADAERASIKYKQVEYMSEYIGKEFNGTISGVTDWGIYVEETRTKCEGMVPLRELGNDFYSFNKKTYTVEGEKTKKKFRLGDPVRFKVMKADLDAKTLDYKIV